MKKKSNININNNNNISPEYEERCVKLFYFKQIVIKVKWNSAHEQTLNYTLKMPTVLPKKIALQKMQQQTNHIHARNEAHKITGLTKHKQQITMLPI